MSDDLVNIGQEYEEVKYFKGAARTTPFVVQAYSPWRTRPMAVFLVFCFVLGFEFAAIFIAATIGKGPVGMIPIMLLALSIIAGAGYARSGRFLLTADGIQFPKYFTLGLKGKTSRAWSELKSIDVDMHSVLKRNSVGLEFEDGSKVNVYLWKLPLEEAQALRNGLLKWCPIQNPRLSDIPAIAEFEREHGFDFGLQQNPVITQRFALASYARVAPRSQVNGYVIETAVAGANYSTTYAARSAMGTKVIVRELRLTDECEDKEALKTQLVDAAQELNTLGHRSIARLLDSFCVGDSFYWVLEDTQGCTLRELDPFSRTALEKRLPELVEPIAYLHQHRPHLVHGLINPACFTVDGHKRIKLCDFGFAFRLLSSATGILAADLRYLPPEQLYCQPDQRSDVFSLGATLYYVMKHSDPQPLSPPAPTLRAEEINPVLAQLIVSCMAADPAQRPADAGEIALSIASLPARVKKGGRSKNGA